MDLLSNFAIILFLSVYLALVSRWHGGGFVGGVPKQIKNFAWALPFSVVTALCYLKTDHDLLLTIVVSVAVLLACMLGKTLGHGGGMDLAHNNKEPGSGRDPEKLEYLILWLHGRIPQFWYDALLLLIVGFCATLGAVVALWGIFTPLAALIAVGGCLKAAGYAYGWALHPAGRDDDFFCDEIDEATEVGEALTGLAAGLCLGLGYALFRSLY